MASGGVTDDLVKKFEEFVSLSAAGKTLSAAEKKQMNSKACGKLVKDCLKSYKNAPTIADASVFPKYKEKGKQYMACTKENIDNFLTDLAHKYQCQELKKSEKELTRDDPKVQECKKKMSDDILKSKADVKVVAQSKTGNVGGLTDTSKYTGAHKERFDESGKGKGSEGRTDKADNTGYVGNYKGQGTFDKKK
ncbi:hypothetical protein ACJMK2_034187 [Sinanodonta woodiana]|uniref:Tubulin polymerization-promoting protein family member 3 n=1 Tax=Sinanodonta woodiana TaxID=1069815 RepID=A0ABD3WUY4_SINWO